MNEEQIVKKKKRITLNQEDLVREISEKVSRNIVKLLVPRMRKMIKEQFDNTIKDLLYENFMNTKKSILSEDRVNTVEKVINKSNTSKKIPLKKTNTSKISRDLAKQYFGDDPLADIIMEAEDAEEEEELLEQERLESDLVPSDQIEKRNVVDPDQIDYSEHLSRLGI